MAFRPRPSRRCATSAPQFHHVNIFDDPELREALKRHSNWPTYPQLYVKGELIGGCDIALEMYRSGELKQAAGIRRRGTSCAT